MPPARGSVSGSPTTPAGPQGPPATRPLPPKRPHRRGPYACDECRLRKRACDAAQPCGPCRRSDTECTYAFRKPAPRPTSQIRTLQNHIRQARGWLRHVRDQTPGGIPGLDLDDCLKSLDFSLPNENEDALSSQTTPSQSSTSQSLEPTPQRQHNMLIGHDRFVGSDGELTCLYGAYSDASFISRTIELLETRPSATRNPQLRSISDLFSRPLYGHAREGSLLSRSHVSHVPQDHGRLLDAVFGRGHLMLSFLPEERLRQLAASEPDASSPNSMLSLLHLVLALGYIYDSEGHRGNLCVEAVIRATRHFDTGVAMAQSGMIQDLTSLGTLICAIVFLLSSYRTASAYSFTGLACSAAIRLGLFSRCPLPPGVPSDVRRTRRRLLGSVVAADRLVPLILDLPCCISQDVLPHSRLEELAKEAEASDDIPLAALLRQSVLLFIPTSVRSQGDSSEESGSGRVRAMQKAQEACHRWKSDVSSLMSRLEQSPVLQGAKAELDMMFSFCQVILFRPHLHYIKNMYLGQTVSVAESYYALACIKVASSTIRLVEDLRDKQIDQSWLSVYAVFSSVMCLVFLVAAHPATTLPNVAWQRACRGVKIIASNNCVDNIAAVCLDILKFVTHSLKETVYIDFDQIEMSTASNCRDHDERPMTTSFHQPQDKHLSEDVANANQQPSVATPGQSDVDWDDLIFDVENETDMMLEQAEALPADIDLLSLPDLCTNE